MTRQAEKERLLSAVEEAMLGDLGDRRIDTLPMDDGRFSQYAAPLRDVPLPQEGPTNKWKLAIADGAFDDDDAMQVAGMDTIADGQLARMHRAGRIAGMIVTAGYDDRLLRQGRNGQIDPRAKFHRGRRGPSMAGRAHHGDGPIQVRHMLSNSRHAPEPPPMYQRPRESSDKSRPQTSGPPQPPPIQAKNRPEAPAQPLAVQVNGSGPQAQQPHHSKSNNNRFSLPDGASVVFETSVELASPTFVDRNASYPGIVYLIFGDDPTLDQIVLWVDNEGIENVKHSPKDYGSLVTQSQEVILQFKDANGRTTWYVVKFSHRDAMVAFVDALRSFVDRPSEPPRASLTEAVTSQGARAANESTKEAPSTVPPSTINAVRPPQPLHNTQLHTPALDHASPAANVALQQQDGVNMVPNNLIEDIVSWVMNIVAFIKENGPAELSTFDALPGLMRGAAAAVLLSRHPNFARLDQQQRVSYIDCCCVPQVFEKFKRRLREQAAPEQCSQEAQAPMPSASPRRVYTVEDMLRVRSMAQPPPHWLSELGFLKEAVRPHHQQVRTPIMQRDEAHDIADYKLQNQQVAPNTSWQSGRTQAPSQTSSSYQDGIIGLYVSNVTSEAEVRAILTDDDQDKMMAVKQWSPSNMVVLFKTTEDRDRALQNMVDELKTRTGTDFRPRSIPLVQIFHRREPRYTNSTHSTSDRSASGEAFQGTSPLVGRSTRIPAAVSESVTTSEVADCSRTAVESLRAQIPHTNYGVDGHHSPAYGLSPNKDDSRRGSGELSSSSPSRTPAITVTAPSEQGTTADNSRARASLPVQSGHSPHTTVTDLESAVNSEGHTGLNASRFNPDNVDLLGENSGSWTGALAQNKSYMHDLASILWTEEFDIESVNDSEITETVDSFAAWHLK